MCSDTTDLSHFLFSSFPSPLTVTCTSHKMILLEESGGGEESGEFSLRENKNYQERRFRGEIHSRTEETASDSESWDFGPR